MVKIKRKTAPAVDEDSFVDPTSRGFIYDEVDDFHDKAEDFDMHDDDDDLSDDDNHKASKEQVLGLDGYDSGDDDDDSSNSNDVMENDIQSPNESDSDDRDGERAMGKKKKYFFGTDLTDQRIHNASRFKSKKTKKNEEASLELEIEGAKQLQQRMKKEMAHGLFSGQLFPNATENEEEALPDKIKEIELNNKVSKSSKKLKKSFLESSPLLEDFREKLEELSDRLSPLMEAKKKGLLPDSSATQYLQTRYLLCLNYLNLISAYMMVKSSSIDSSEHPAETRLAQYKHLFVELEPCKRKYDEELTALLSDVKAGKLKAKPKTKGKRRLLAVVKATTKQPVPKSSEEEDLSDSDTEEMDLERGKDLQLDKSSSEGEESEKEGEAETGPVDDQARRVITREIAKNKGLLPSRKKEQRNPRVKYKRKYQQKLKRRKGQVREVRRETERYAGEISGIKANVIKSVKLK